jgi:hypothetical protein
VKLSRMLLAFLIIAAAALAQNQPSAQGNWTPPQNAVQNWFPIDIESLGQYASSRTEFSLDHNMVVLASKGDQDDNSLRRVIAGVDGISVHRFKFQGPGMYNPQLLATIRADYSQAGWQHLADAHQRYGYPQGTDLWLHLEHNTIRNIAFLITRPDQVAFVSVSGAISPIDLLHLAGHFGIPRIQGGVVVQDPGAGAGSYPPSTSTAPPVDNPPNQPNQPDDDYRHENSAPDTNAPATTPN